MGKDYIMGNEILKIGDKVIWAIDNKEYIIIGDKETPIEMQIIGNRYPKDGFDFLIRQSIDSYSNPIDAKIKDLQRLG